MYQRLVKGLIYREECTHSFRCIGLGGRWGDDGERHVALNELSLIRASLAFIITDSVSLSNISFAVLSSGAARSRSSAPHGNFPSMFLGETISQWLSVSLSFSTLASEKEAHRQRHSSDSVPGREHAVHTGHNRVKLSSLLHRGSSD